MAPTRFRKLVRRPRRACWSAASSSIAWPARLTNSISHGSSCSISWSIAPSGVNGHVDLEFGRHLTIEAVGAIGALMLEIGLPGHNLGGNGNAARSDALGAGGGVCALRGGVRVLDGYASALTRFHLNDCGMLGLAVRLAS